MATINRAPYVLERSSDAASEPVTAAEAKAYMNVDYTTDDTLIAELITTARLELEAQLGLSFINTTWILYLDCFPLTEIVVPRSPISSVTSIAYLDENGDSQTWASTKYQVDKKSLPGRIKPTEAEGSFPNTQDDTYNTVTITYVAGFGADDTSTEEKYKTLIRRMVRTMYDEERDPDAPKRTPAHILAGILNNRILWPR